MILVQTTFSSSKQAGNTGWLLSYKMIAMLRSTDAQANCNEMYTQCLSQVELISGLAFFRLLV